MRSQKIGPGRQTWEKNRCGETLARQREQYEDEPEAVREDYTREGDAGSTTIMARSI